MLIRFLLLISTCIFAQFQTQEWGSITSLLTPTGIQIAADGTVYSSTSGGLLEFNPNTEKFTPIKMEDGLVYLDLSCIEIDNQGRLWLGGAYPKGYLQVYDPILGLVRKITHLDIAVMKMIRVGGNYAFAVYEGTTSGNIGILEFSLDDEGLPNYQDSYSNFTDKAIMGIRDFDLLQDSLLYVTTDKGIFVGNVRDNLKLSESWVVVYEGNDAKQYMPIDDGFTGSGFLITDSLILNIYTNESFDLFNRWPYCEKPDSEGNLVECPSLNSDIFCEEYINNDSNNNLGKCGPGVVSAEWNGQKMELLLDQLFIVLDDINTEVYSRPIPFSEWAHYKSKYTSFATSQDKIILGMDLYGLISIDSNSDLYQLHVPNTSHTNEYFAISVTSSGNLAAVSQTGVLIASNNYGDEFIYDNALSYPDYKYFPKVDEQNNFQNTLLIYHIGKYSQHNINYSTYNIIEKNNGNLIYGNTGLWPKPAAWDVKYPAVIELNPSTYEFSSFDTMNQVIDGRWGIIYNDYLDMFMEVNEIAKDKKGNIWVTNPFCEKYGNLLAIQIPGETSWSHVSIPDNQSYRPQTIAFDQLNRAWVGFVYDARDDWIYSNGGIKVFDPSDSSWVLVENLEKLPGNDSTASVWSLAFDEMEFLWVMNEKGIRFYEYKLDYSSNFISIDPFEAPVEENPNEMIAYEYLSNISFVKGNRIRVDSQNNKWIITHQGVWIIQESMSFWPSEEGLHPENSGLLSDKVYDVAFDDGKGLAYLATDKGISILQIPFADNPSKAESMYISPNPFIIPDDEGVIIKNIAAGSIIKIMTITGTLIEEIRLPSNHSQAVWDGTDAQGVSVGTAVYLVAAHHPLERNKVAKIAVIHK